jgi:hypothetical protein
MLLPKWRKNKMDTIISQESFDFIIAQLEGDDMDCSWEIARLPYTHRDDLTYQYWKTKQAKIRKAVGELQGLIKLQ